MPLRIDRAVMLVSIAVLLVTTSCFPPPDLVIDQLGTPQALQPGDSFVLTSRVCNDSDEPTSPDALDIFVQAPGQPGSEAPLGGRPVPMLEPGQCHSEEVLLSAPWGLPDGPYKLLGRLLESGHQRATGIFGIGYLPDLVIEEIVGTPSALPFSSFDVSARICNRGTVWSAPTHVALYLSEDWWLVNSLSNGTTLDVPAGGGLAVPDLPPGACSTVEGVADAQVPGDRAYVLGGIVDEWNGLPELIESNNAHMGHRMGIGMRPNLVVRSITAPYSALSGQSIEVEGTVCNQGTESSSISELSFYFSEDALITPPPLSDPAAGDPWLGAFSVPSLPAGACHTTVDFINTAVPFDGEWILGAVVDETQSIDELIENDNALAGPFMGVGDGPDLVVQSIVGPPSAEHGTMFDVDVEVCNRGTGYAQPSELHLHLTNDSVLGESTTGPGGPGPDGLVGAEPVSGVAPSSCVTTRVSAYADSSIVGAARLVARADALDDLPELRESNNETWGAFMGVGSDPDFVVRSLSAPASIYPGASFEVTFEVCNQGTTPSPVTEVAFYHSSDSTVSGGAMPIPGPDLPAGMIMVTQPLLPGACLLGAGMLTADSFADGAYYLGAIVDELDSVMELQEANNIHVGPLMGVGYGPDLVVTGLDAPPSALPGASMSIDFTVCNQGTDPSDPTLVAFHDSNDTDIERGFPPHLMDDDRWLGDGMVPFLAPGGCFAGSTIVWLPSEAVGARHLAAYVDDPEAIVELIESNNLLVGPIVGIGYGPDLVVTNLSAPPSASSSGEVSIGIQVCNQGTGPSSPTSLWLYLSEDEEIEGSYFDPISGDPWLAESFIPMLAPGECFDDVAIGWPAVPEPGSWFVGGIVDEGDYVVELVESNNTALGPVMGIGDAPDLIVTSLTVPGSAEMGISFPVAAEVCNQGTTPSPASTLMLIHSQDAEITSPYGFPPSPDMPFGDLPVSPLLAGECTQVFGSGMASLPTDGAWYTGAIIDVSEMIPELMESNNTLVDVVMGIGYGPDLKIELLEPPPTVSIGEIFPVDLRVCNEGTAPSPPTDVMVYHSENDAHFLDEILPDTGLVGFDIPDLAPGACHFESKPLSIGLPGPGYLAAEVDEFDGIPELVETNNTRLEELVVVP